VEVCTVSFTNLEQAPPQGARSDNSLQLAWISVGFIPVFLLASVVVVGLLYQWFGYKPENADAPLWLDLVIAAIAMVIFIAPCVTSVLYGRRAMRVGKVGGVFPLLVGALAGLSLTVLTVVSTLGPF
jgi:hypothetical protein